MSPPNRSGYTLEIDSRRPVGEEQETTSSGDNKSKEDKRYYISQVSVILIIVNVTCGDGMLAMPRVVQDSGIIPSLVLQSLFLIGSIMTCVMASELTLKSDVDSFNQLAKYYCHKYVYQFTRVTIFLLLFGVQVAHMVIIGDQFDRIFASLYGPTFCYKWYMNRKFLMTVSVFVFVVPILYLKSLRFLKYVSSLGVLALGSLIYVVVSEFNKIDEIAKDVNYFPEKWTKTISILPVFSLAYHSNLTLVPIMHTTKKKEKYTTYRSIIIAYLTITSIYLTVSLLAVFTFGSTLQNDLTESYQSKSVGVLALLAIVAFKSTVTLPMIYLPASLNLIDILKSSSEKFRSMDDSKQKKLVTISFYVSYAVALVVPDILVAVNTVGAFAVSFTFVIPGLAYLRFIDNKCEEKDQVEYLHGDKIFLYSTKDKFKRAISYMFIIIGFALTFLVLIRSFQKMFFGGEEPPPLCHL